MKHALTWFGLLSLMMLCAPWPGATALAESIESFSVSYDIARDGTVEVREAIDYDFGAQERHGIFRTLEATHAQPATAWYKDRRVDITVTDVSLNNGNVPYTIEQSSRTVFLQIGDPDRTVTGQQHYEITYTLRGALSYFDDGSAELYWNVTGLDWTVPILEARAQVFKNDGLVAGNRACYQGPLGATDSCDETTDTDTAVVFTARDIGFGSGLTIGVALETEGLERQIVETFTTVYVVIPLFLLTLLGFTWYFYRYETMHRPDVPIIPQYEPYPGILPMYTGVLLDGRLDPRDISAGLMYLAEQGFIKIKKTEQKILWLFDVDDYEITLQKSLQHAPAFFHKTILQLLFSSLDTPGKTISLSALRTDTRKSHTNFTQIQSLKTAIAKDLQKLGFYEHYVLTRAAFIQFSIVGAVLVIVIFTIPSLAAWSMLLIGGVVVMSVIGSIVLYRRRTRKGYEARNHILGFKDFLATTDKDRFTFHNSPRHNPETFMAYLPYAVSLGVETEWAEVFCDITIPAPQWYDGGTAGTFSSTTLTKDLGAFSTAFASSSGTSSSSSGGSGGGGSSGGGGGGGGGGSW